MNPANGPPNQKQTMAQEKFCKHPQHDRPVTERGTGVQQHTCPSCGRITVYTVHKKRSGGPKT